MKKLLAGLAILAALGIGGIAFAQTQTQHMSVSINQSGKIKLEGTVVSISGATLNVNSWGGVWSVDTTNAKIVRRFGGASNLSEFQVGDDVVISGTSSVLNLSVSAKDVKNNTIQTKNVSPDGTISNLNTGALTFTLTTQANKTYQVTASTSTVVKINNATTTVSFGNLVNGMKARVEGVLDRNQLTILAKKITARQ